MKKGFTLTELAIVLVIIGIILSGALKSAEIIKDAKARKNITQITSLADAQHEFFERTGRYGGDSDNDGLINHSTINSNTAPDEANITAAADMDFAFAELEQMGILSDQNNSIHASLTDGGPAYYAGVEVTDADSGNTYIYNVLVIRQVPCLTAFQMEMSLDKNQPDDTDSASTGRVRYIDGDALLAEGEWTASDICADNTDTVTHIAYLFDQF